MDSWIEWMKQRTSWRSYNNEKLSEAHLKQVMDFLENPGPAPFGNVPRFLLLDNLSGDGKIGTYGFIRGARHFIVGAVEESPMGVEDYGYLFEKIILYATGLGLGTCWLGGTFTRDTVLDRLMVTGDEFVPAISPLGYKSEPGLIGKAIRWGAGSRNRKPWGELFYRGELDSPLSRDMAGEYETAFEMVRIGPSASNGQPWRLVLDGDSVLFCHGEKNYSTMKRLDMGIAMCHFDYATRGLGFEGAWSVEDVSAPGYVATWRKSA